MLRRGTLSVGYEVDGLMVRFVVQAHRRPVEGVVVNVVTPVDVTPAAASAGHRVGKGWNHPVLGPANCVNWPERTMYPGNHYVYEVEMPPFAVTDRGEFGAPVECEVSGWSGRPVQAHVSVILEENDDAA